MAKYQPRYIAYAAANNMTPSAMLSHDKDRFKGGCMAGFMIWITEKSREYQDASPESFIGKSLINHEGFTDFITRGDSNA